MTPGTGAFVVRASSGVSVAPSTPETRRIAADARPHARDEGRVLVGAVSLELARGGRLGDEGYELTVTRVGGSPRRAAPAGLFYGVQTLRQLLPVAGSAADPGRAASATDRASPGAARCSTSPGTSGRSATSSASST